MRSYPRHGGLEAEGVGLVDAGVAQGLLLFVQVLQAELAAGAGSPSPPAESGASISATRLSLRPSLPEQRSASVSAPLLPDTICGSTLERSGLTVLAHPTQASVFGVLGKYASFLFRAALR